MSFRKIDSRHFRDVYVAEFSTAGYSNSNHIAQQIEKELYQHSYTKGMMGRTGNEPILVVVVKDSNYGLLSYDDRRRQEMLYQNQMMQSCPPPASLSQTTTQAIESKPNNILLLT